MSHRHHHTSLAIGLIGALGRMGQCIAHEALKAGHRIAVPCVRPHATQCGQDYGMSMGIAPLGVALTDIQHLSGNQADVFIDFSQPQSLFFYQDLLMEEKIPLVLGTTGLGPQERDILEKLSQHIPIFSSANMSIGVHVLHHLVSQAARFLPHDFQIEILEKHHQFKRDAPSGTALDLAQTVAQARNQSLDDDLTLGHRSQEPREPQSIGISSLRAGGWIGEHTTYFVSGTEEINLHHRAFSRHVFAQGALKAAQWIVLQPPGLYGMKDLLHI